MSLNVRNLTVRGKLNRAVDRTDTTLPLKFGEGLKFRVPDGDHFFATIRSFGHFEHVKVLRVDGDKLHVVRGQDNTKAQDWSADSCVIIEWNPAQLCEFVKSCVVGLEPISVEAGTHCLSCATCIEIADDGRIRKVIQGEQC